MRWVLLVLMVGTFVYGFVDAMVPWLLQAVQSLVVGPQPKPPPEITHIEMPKRLIRAIDCREHDMTFWGDVEKVKQHIAKPAQPPLKQPFFIYIPVLIEELSKISGLGYTVLHELVIRNLPTTITILQYLKTGLVDYAYKIVQLLSIQDDIGNTVLHYGVNDDNLRTLLFSMIPGNQLYFFLTRENDEKQTALFYAKNEELHAELEALRKRSHQSLETKDKESFVVVDSRLST